MKGYITSIIEEDTSFLLEVSIEKPSILDSDEHRKEAFMSKEERHIYYKSEEYKKLISSMEEEETAIRESLRLGEVELTRKE